FRRDRVRQRERTGETAIRSLDAMIVVRFVFLFELTFAAEGDHVALDRQIKVLSIHARQFGLEHNLLFVLIDVHAGTPRAPRNTFFVKRARDTAGKKPVHFFLQSSQVAKRVITNDTHFLLPPKSLWFA